MAREGEENTLVIPVYYLLANLICSERNEKPFEKEREKTQT